MSGRVLATNGFWSTVSHVLHRGSLMLGTIILARSLEPADFAAYGYFQMTITMLATYAALGLGTTASRFFAEVGHTPDEQLPPVGTLLALSLIIAACAFLVILVAPRFVLDSGLAVPQWMIALGVAVTVAGIVPAGAVLGLEKYRTASLVSLLSGISMLLLVVIASRQGSPAIAMWSLVIALGVQVGGQLLVISRTVGVRRLSLSARWSSAEFRRILSFAGPMFLVSILAGSSSWIIGRLILADGGEREFALFIIGMQWLALGLLLPGMVSRVVLPRLVRNRHEDSRHLVRVGTGLALMPAVGLVVIAGVLAPWIIGLYGSNYAGSTHLIPAFLAVAVAAAPINTIGNAILARDGQLEWLLFTVIWFCILFLAFSFVPMRSAGWAAFCLGAAYLLMLAQVILYARKKLFI